MKCDHCYDPPRTRCSGEYKASCLANDMKREMHATVRITTRCTQSCAHCCYSCGPGRADQMSASTSLKVASFLSNNGIKTANVMGGEFFCNPEWHVVLPVIAGSVRSMRLVTNGDWASSKPLAKKVIGVLGSMDNIHVGISKDKWHSNGHVDMAAAACRTAGIPFKVECAEMGSDSVLVPVGRARHADYFFASIARYCAGDGKAYSFLIDEGGRLFKCQMGIWQFDTIDDYVDGGFSGRFKEVWGAFLKSHISSCNSCIRIDREINASAID